MKKKVIYHVFFENRDGSFDVYQSSVLETAHTFFVSLYQRPEIVRAKVYKPLGMRIPLRSFDRRSTSLN